MAQRFEADLGRRIGDLSRGNRQKVGLIQAVFHDPELLVLDEPTTGLDPLMQEEFVTVIGEYRDRGGTVFLSSHDLDEVERVCDAVAIVRDGRIAAVENVAELRGRAYHHVSIEFDSPVDDAEFMSIPGVIGLEVDGSRVSFKAFGDLDPVVKAAARHTVEDMELTEPTLEEIFLTFYGRAPARHERPGAAEPAVASPGARRPAPGWWVSLSAVVRRGLLDRRRSVLIWGGSLGALGAFMAAIYPTIQSSIEQVAKSYPAGLKEAFGVQAMNTVEGYIHAELFSLIVPLAIGYYAVRAVATPIVGAEERGYLDTILSLPLPRTILVAGSCIVAAVSSAAILALLGASTFIVGRIAGTHISLGLVAAGVAGVLPLALFAGGLAALASGTLRSSLTVSGAAIGNTRGDVRPRPRRAPGARPRPAPVDLGLPLLRCADAGRDRPGLVHRTRRRWNAAA